MGIDVPQIDRLLCTACGECALACPQKAVTLVSTYGPVVDDVRCTLCGLCEDVCPADAVDLPVWIHLG